MGICCFPAVNTEIQAYSRCGCLRVLVKHLQCKIDKQCVWAAAIREWTHASSLKAKYKRSMVMHALMTVIAHWYLLLACQPQARPSSVISHEIL